MIISLPNMPMILYVLTGPITDNDDAHFREEIDDDCIITKYADDTVCIDRTNN